MEGVRVCINPRLFSNGEQIPIKDDKLVELLRGMFVKAQNAFAKLVNGKFDGWNKEIGDVSEDEYMQKICAYERMFGTDILNKDKKSRLKMPGWKYDIGSEGQLIFKYRAKDIYIDFPMKVVE